MLDLHFLYVVYGSLTIKEHNKIFHSLALIKKKGQKQKTSKISLIRGMLH
ncbi:MAG: hypothetical protein HQK51_21735 [Oligoflexia bacterium]|nr:hypothetical protein [Oligoflexia bacterium]